MSGQNIDLAIQYYEAPDFASATHLLADDVIFTFHGESRRLAGASTVSGKESAVKWLADWFSRFDPDYRMEIQETRDLGDRVLVVTKHHATGRSSGVPINQTTTQIMTLNAGRITHQEFFPNLDEALEAAGLPE